MQSSNFIAWRRLYYGGQIRMVRCLPAVKSFTSAGLWQEESKDIKRQQNCIKCVQSVVSA